MTTPYNKIVHINYYDTGTYQFQLTEGGMPVSEDLTTQNFKFFIRGSSAFTPIEKDIVQEGWIVNNETKIIKVEIDTEAMNLLPPNHIFGAYVGRLEWVDRKKLLVSFNIEIHPNPLWSLGGE